MTSLIDLSLSRRRLLKLSVGGTAISLLGPGALRPAYAAGGSLQRVSPRGYVETPDDFHFRVAQKQGYFGDLKVDYLGGPQDGTANVRLVDQGQADLSAPSPGVFALGVDKGLDVAFFFAKHPVDIFSFASRKGQGVKNPEDLAGKSVLLGSIGWKPIVDSEVAQVGVDPAKGEIHRGGRGLGASAGRWQRRFRARLGRPALSVERQGSRLRLSPPGENIQVSCERRNSQEVGIV